MSQTKVDFSQNPTGPQLMDDYLAKMQENVLTTNSGLKRPDYAKQGTLWIDMSITPWLLKVYDGSQDITLGKIDINNDKFISSNPMTTTGDMIVQGVDGNPNRIAPGTEGYVLMSNGAGKLPSYRDVGSEYARADSVVTLTGNQTIAGSKTFSSSLTTKTGGSAMLKGVLPNNTVGTNPSSSVNVYVAGVDNGGKDQSYISFGVNTDGSGFINVMARSNSASDRGSNGIGVRKNLDGTSTMWISTTTATAPTPATSDNSTKIVTTAFVNNKINAKFQIVTALPSNPDANTFYFIKES